MYIVPLLTAKYRALLILFKRYNWAYSIVIVIIADMQKKQ